MVSLLRIALVIGLASGSPSLRAQPAAKAKRPPRPTPPTRDPHTPGYVQAGELADGKVPPANKDGNFIIGPTHTPSPDAVAHDGVPQGTIVEFVMKSEESKIYPGIAREEDTFGTPDPKDPAKLIV